MRVAGILVVLVALVCPISGAEPLQCGDMDGNGTIDVGDLVSLVRYMFEAGPPPIFLPAADCDGSSDIDISDLICWVNWMFGGSQIPPACPIAELTDLTVASSGCLADSVGKGGTPHLALTPGYLYLEADGYNLHVRHMAAYYQCCLMYHVQWYQAGPVLVGFETDTGALCDCYCDFNLESVLFGLDSGQYSVILFGIEDDTVGIGDVMIPGEGPQVVDCGDSGCIELYSHPDSAVVDYVLSGDTLSMNHQNGWFNCGGIIATEFAMSGDTLRFYELNVSDEWAFCMCYFNVWASVVGIQPGVYVAELYARDWPEDPIELIDRRTIQLGD